jgi:S1-C subfamily serine protease
VAFLKSKRRFRFKRVSPSVFIVEVLDESASLVVTGSGVAVESDQIVTDRHVIDGGAILRIKQRSRTWLAAVTHLDPDHDLCRLTVEGLKAPPALIENSLHSGV